MKSNFNTINLTIIGVGVILIICALRGDTPAAFIAPFLGRTDIPKGTLKLNLTSGASGTGTATDTTTVPSKPSASTAPADKPAPPTTSAKASLTSNQTITSV